MTPRENVLSLFRRTGYSAAPVQLPLCPSQWETFKKVAGGRTLEEYFDYPMGFALSGVPGPRQVGPQNVDWRRFYSEPLKESTTFDGYGVGHEPGSEACVHMTRMHHPMAGFDSIEQIAAYPWPVFAMEDLSATRSSVDAAHRAGKAAVGHMACTVWERAWYLRDMTKLMTDMVMEPDRAAAVLDRVTEISCRMAEAFARSGVDVLHLGDDVGMQQTIMMSKGMYQEWLKPRLAAVIQSARAAKPDIIIHYHSCGYVEPLIDDLIEAGINVLNPVQPECMDFTRIQERFGNRLSFDGTIGTQTTMPFGTPEEVRRTVWKNLELCGPKGGLLAAPTHLIEPEVPWANIEAYVRACRDFHPG